MTDMLEIRFVSIEAAKSSTLVILAGPDVALGAAAKGLIGKHQSMLQRAAAAADFTGKTRSSIELLAPSGLDVSRLLVLGTGPTRELQESDWINLGGVAYA